MKLAFTTPCRFLPAHGQSHESILLTRLVPISVAPEAQWMFTAVQDIGSIESAPLLIKALGQG
jgi:hypothetical protein